MNVNPETLLAPVTYAINTFDRAFQTDIRARLITWKLGFHSPAYRFSKDQIAFIHIPKTGGTTLSEILGRQNNSSQFVNLHMHRPVSKYCSPQEYQYITMLRHPVGRVFSYYKMAERKDIDNPYSHLCGKGLEHFITHCWETRDMCCRYIAGNTRKEVDEEVFETAKQNLLNFRFVGIFEEFESSIDQLFAWLGQTGESLPHLRQSPRTTPSKSEISIIENYNRYDIRLYEFYLNQRKPDATPDNV